MMTLHLFFRAIALVAFSALSLYSQIGTKQASPLLSATTPEAAGMDAKRLSRLDGIIQSYIDKGALSICYRFIRD